MSNETKAIVPLEAGMMLGVRCYVQGILHGSWARLTAELGLGRDELEQIGNQFYDRQQAYNEWRAHKARQFEAVNDTTRAEEWRGERCMLCGDALRMSTGVLVCPCYRNYRVGFAAYLPVDPLLHLRNWQGFGGKWEGNEPRGARTARSYANKIVYSDECIECFRPFMVTVSEILKVARAIVDDETSGGDGRYHLRRTCAECKAEARARRRARDTRAAAPVRELRRVVEDNPAAVGEKGGSR